MFCPYEPPNSAQKDKPTRAITDPSMWGFASFEEQQICQDRTRDQPVC